MNIRFAPQIAIAAIALTSGCSPLTPVSTGQSLVGQPASAVEARFGEPREQYPRTDGGTRWLYPTWPLGQRTYAADFNNNGHLTSFRQILTSADFAQIRIGESTQHEVLQTFGKPEQITNFPETDRIVWSYRFRRDGVWPALMNVYFDRDNVVRLTQLSRDPRYDEGQE